MRVVALKTRLQRSAEYVWEAYEEERAFFFRREIIDEGGGNKIIFVFQNNNNRAFLVHAKRIVVEHLHDGRLGLVILLRADAIIITVLERIHLQCANTSRRLRRI